MNDLQLKLAKALRWTILCLQDMDIPKQVVAQIEHLAEEVDQPCVVAVVGRVKAGKSTFINALLGQDLAKAGPTETTATINFFRYGTPDPDFPVRCHWRGGKITDENKEFLDNLQGNDFETLRLSDGIDHLEYHVQNHYLEQIILVDTPGTGAVIDEHQNQTAEFLQLYRQLRERHHEDTQRIGNKADAVIYLIGETARISDEAFLQEFQQSTQGQSRSLNAIGVMAKIDLNSEIIKRRHELAKKIAGQLQNNLNTVIPVSAGIQRALDLLLAEDQAKLKQMIATLRGIPSTILDELLSDSELYLETDCPVSPAERKEIRGEMRWKVFTTIARLAADTSLDETTIVKKLQEIAGFDQLQEVLDQHFVKRGSLLHSYRIVNDILQILNNLKFTYLHDFRRREAEYTTKRERFLTFIQQVQSRSPVLGELEAFIKEQLAPHVDPGTIIEGIERDVLHIKYELEEYNADFEALVAIEDNSIFFTLQELSELRSLFGLYGLDIKKRLPPNQITLTYIGERQEHWEQRGLAGRNSAIRTVAQQAVRRYGLIANTEG